MTKVVLTIFNSQHLGNPWVKQQIDPYIFPLAMAIARFEPPKLQHAQKLVTRCRLGVFCALHLANFEWARWSGGGCGGRSRQTKGMTGMFTSARRLTMLPIAGLRAGGAQVGLTPCDVPQEAFGHRLAFLNAGPDLRLLRQRGSLTKKTGGT